MVHSPASDEHVSGGSAFETLVDHTSGPSVRDTDALTKGSSIGRYVVLGRIGGGGMGVVYAAYDPKLDRRIAVKVLRRRRRKNQPEEVDRARMLREAQALARLSHPNVVAVHDAGLHEGRVFVAMDFVEGQDLRAWVESQRPTRRAIIEAYIEAARGLAAAHEAGLVHRDFKPDNAVRDERGRVRVLDFGLARTTGTTGPHRAVAPKNREEIVRRLASDANISIDTPLTIEGARVGTPAYMAPEQHLGDPTDARTDQFALCASLYEALYGELPFCDDSVHSIAFASIEGEVRAAPRGAHVPQWLRRVLVRGLAPAPADRWPSIDALVEQLQRDPARGRRRALTLGAGAVVLVGAVWGYAAGDRDATVCNAAPGRLAEVWSSDRATTIADAFESTGRPYAGHATGAVTERLDAFGEAWVQMHTDTCEATEVRHEQSAELLDLRMACLDGKLLALDALASRFEDADGDVVDHAISAARDLPALDACADLTALRETPAPSPDERELARGLAEANADHATGREELAIATGRRLVAEARQLDAPALLAQALALLGTALETTGEYGDAERYLLEAAVQAEAAGDARLLARLRVVLVLVAGDRLARTDKGRVWAELAAPTLDRVDASPTLRAQLESNLAQVASREGKPDEALAHKRRALALVETMDAPDELVVAGVHADLANSLAEAHEFEAAKRHAERALALWMEVLGPDHRRTAFGHATLAYVYDSAGAYDEAMPQHERAIEILEAVLGPDAVPVAPLRNNAGVCAIRRGDHARGVLEFRRVLEIRERAYGPDHIEVASSLGNLSGILRMQGELEEAQALARRALAIREAALPDDHPDVGASLATLANIVEEEGDHAGVVPMRERVLEIFAKAYGSEHPRLVTDLGNLAYSAAHAGLTTRAEVVARRALRLAETHDLEPEVAAFARLTLAIALSKRGRPADEVRTLVDEALVQLGTRSAPTERKIITELARAHGWDDLDRPD